MILNRELYMKSARHFITVFISLILCVACSGSGNSGGDGGGITQSNAGNNIPADGIFMKFALLGKPYSFTNTQTELQVDAVTNGMNSLVITGVSKTDTVSMQISLLKFADIGPFTTTVSYSMGENSNSKTVAKIIFYKDGIQYQSDGGSPCLGTTGQLTIAKITDDFVEGTFSANAKALSQCVSTTTAFISVTEGSFKAKIRKM
jgi:Family of unknown function (DUF6252)